MAKNAKLVLVTGGAGFIGSHVCEELLGRGYRVRVLDNLSLGKREWVPSDAGLEFIRGDVCDSEACRAACDGVEGVFHLAAMSKVAPSVGDPSMVQYCTGQNVLGTLNVLEAASAAGVKKVIYSASSTFYGNRPPPHSEDMLPDCLSPYALTKYVGEQYCELYDKMYDLPTLSLRYFQVCGPRQPSAGPYAVVAGIFIEQERRGEPLTIHGDGSQRRDFVYVRDVAEANVRAYESGARRMVINVGTGVSRSIKELADMISDKQISGLPRRGGDSDATLADTSRCARVLGWLPAIKFEAMVEEMLSAEHPTT